ncbi:MAG: DUF2937 family protein [Parvularculaceae bacterium]
MLGRLIALIVGAAAAVGASQGPGFTLQYMQNLAGRIDELRPIVEDFDAKISGYGYTREAALAECHSSSGLLEALCSTYETTVMRYDELLAHQNELKATSEYMRPLLLARTYKRDIAQSVYDEFKPAMPVTAEGFAYGGGGFLAGWGFLSILFGMLGAMTGGRRYA